MTNLAALKRDAGRAIGVPIETSPIEAREGPILASQFSYGPIFDAFEGIAREHHFRDLAGLMIESDDLQLAICILDFLDRDLSHVQAPVNGTGKPFPWKEAKVNFLTSVLGSTKSSYAAWHAKESKLNDAFGDLKPQQRLARFAIGRRDQLRGRPACVWSSAYFMGYLYKAAEGSNRALVGRAVERAVRMALMELAEGPDFAFEVASCEVGVSGTDGSVNFIDCRITDGRSTGHIHCKCSQTHSNGYGHIYSRELLGTARDLYGPSTFNVACFFGPGWEGPTETLDMPKLIAPDFFSLKPEERVAWLKEQILAMGFLEVFRKNHETVEPAAAA